MEPHYFHGLITPQPPDNLTHGQEMLREEKRLQKYAARNERFRQRQTFWTDFKRKLAASLCDHSSD